MYSYVRIRPLTEEEYLQLRKMSLSSKLCTGRVKRAQIMLLSNQGYLAVEIGGKLGIHERTARLWIGRFHRLGIAGLEEGPREGCPWVYSLDKVGIVLQTAFWCLVSAY
jgi:transposase